MRRCGNVDVTDKRLRCGHDQSGNKQIYLNDLMTMMRFVGYMLRSYNQSYI